MKKRITWIGAIVLVLVSTLVIGIIGNVTNGFQNFDKESIEENMQRKVNEDNLYTAKVCDLVDTNDGNGISIYVDEKTGAITIDGKNTSDTALDYTIGTVTLDKGTYTLTAVSGASKQSLCVSATVSGVATPYYFDFNPNNTIEITTDGTEVTLKLHIAAGAEFNNKAVLPVIVEGEESGSFYN